MSDFYGCPNCGSEPEEGVFGGYYFTIYECENCETLYCWHCGGKRCPVCNSENRTSAGTCYRRSND